MMGRQSGQMSMMILDLSELIPANHLLRQINQIISFDFIYDLVAPYYPANGRPSVDPVSMFKMLLVGYLYGIKSERRLVQEIQLNIAYRWFCGFELTDKIPNHSTFSKTRLRKWNESHLFQQVFLEIIRRCVKSGLVDGKELAADGTYLPANVSKDSWIDMEVETELSMQSYLDRLDEELSKQPGFKKPAAKTIKKRRTTSKTDPDSGCINHGKKSGIGYLMETTVDCKYGIITGVDVYPANEKESLLVLRHLERQIQNGVPMQNIALDRGYDTGAVHRGLELLGITGYIPAIQFSNSPEKYGFYYLPQEDAFCCPEGARLVYQRLNCSQTTGKYLRCYQVQGDTCRYCKRNSTCFKQTGIRRRILGSSCYPAFYRGHERIGSDTYWHMMRLRKIWAEGSFSVLKREHCLSKVRKRGIPAVTEECLLSVMALNLKRMVKAILFTSYMLKIWAENINFQPRFLLVNRSHDIFHHGDTGFRFKYMRKVKRTDMKPRSQLMQLQRFNIVRIQILHDILNEFLCILVCDHVGLLSSMQFIIYNAQQSVCQLSQCCFMIYILPIQHIKRKQNMLHCGPVIRKIQNRILLRFAQCIRGQPLQRNPLQNTAVAFHIVPAKRFFPVHDSCIANHQIAGLYKVFLPRDNILPFPFHHIEQFERVIMLM